MKMVKLILTMTAIAVLVCLVSCGTSKTATDRISAQAELTADNYRITDWKDRSIGEIANPVWLLPAVRGNWNTFKSEWPISPDKVLKISVARHATLNGAQTIADVQYSARLASQLRQSVLSRAAISLGTDGEFDMVNNAAVQTQVSIAGQERLTDFWQAIEITGTDGRRTRMFSYWVVYACDSAVWDQLVAKYIHDIVGRLPDTRTQQTIAGMFNDINAELKYERERSEAQFNAELAARQQALMQPMSTSQMRSAYQSDDPAARAAAGTSAADMDYIAALTALSGGR